MVDLGSSLDTLTGALSAATSNPISYAKQVAADPSKVTSPDQTWYEQIESWFTDHLPDFIAIVLGLLLVAAGIFQFDKVQQVTGAAAKAAAAV